MYIQRLSLTNYRNYRTLALTFSPGCVIVQGGNAQGKTNLLESIHYLTTAGTPHALSDLQLVNWETRSPASEPIELLRYARLEGDFVTDGETRHIEITLAIDGVQGSESGRLEKTIKVDGVNKRVTDLAGLINIVLFSPTDTELIAGSPGVRRRFLDDLLGQLDPRYARTLLRYNKIVSQRNHLLRRLRDEGGDPAEVVFWNEQLVEYGAAIVAYRLRAVSRLSERAQAIQADLTGDRETLVLDYASSVIKGPAAESVLQTSPDAADALPVLSREEIEEIFHARLEQREGPERARGVTLIGPHRADVKMTVNQIDMGVYSSRGQQRTIALALRLAEAELIQAVTGAAPVLLLDDVMSELDVARRQFLESVAQRHQQAFLTSTDLKDFSEAFLAQARLLHVEDGTVEEIGSEAQSPES